MNKKTKLYEKSTRIPKIRELNWEKTVASYLESVETLTSESAKSQRFLLLLNELFGLQPGFIEDYVSGIEKYVKVRQKDRLLKGRVDELFGSLIMEFERNLAQKQTEAEDQLKKYLACLWSQEPPGQRTPYLCLATDGVSFAVYSPFLQEIKKEEIHPEEVQLKLIEQIDWSGLEPQEVYFWLDRYFLRQEIFSPKTENITKDFGIKSHAFQVAGQTLLSLWKSLGSKPEFVVVYESWNKYLLIVYGSSVADAELFIRHTYLATLAKLMAWSRLSQIGDSAFSGTSTPLNDNQLVSILEGQFFKNQGIENFLEEDFFCWITRQQAKETGVEIAHRLLSLLQNYNLKELSEDVLKSLYQELVDPATRHDLGEYYTPDWLAHRMIKKLLQNNPRSSVLDPSCGSGTFLYLTVREKRELLPESSETLQHILSAVAGVDIHPLAVIVAKTNYLLALGDLLKKRRGRTTIPIYLADTLRLPEHEVQRNLEAPLPSYMVEIDGRTVYLPEKLLEKPALYDEGIEAAKEFALQNLGKSVTEEQFANYVQAHHSSLSGDKGFVHALFLISETLKDFIESRRDTIWAFILKNIYKPLFLKGKYDLVVGNPPWLSFRYAEPEYQKFLKEQITHSYRLLSGKGELITHLELATLFLVRAADLYLKEGGNMAFVLPRSLFSADQHDALRQGKFKEVALRFQEIWDLEKVTPLFHVPACVLFCQKESNVKVTYPIPGQMLKGELTRHNAALDEAEKRLAIQNIQISLSRVGKRSFWTPAEGITGEKESYYRRYFRQGASIVPRSFWFVEVRTSPLGFNPQLPPLVSAIRARNEAKERYQGLILRGNVEERFLYATLLSTDILPFGHLDFRLIVLPITPGDKGYKLVTADEAHYQGLFYLANWLRKAQQEWEERRKKKAQRMDVLGRLDYHRKLTCQNPKANYKVIYPASASYLCACIIKNLPIEFDIEGQQIQTRGFIADTKTYYIETDNENEAFYLTAVLNAPLIDTLIKPMQSRGLWGPRDIHKKVFEFPIPQFDVSRQEHLNLAELGQACTEKVTEWLQSGGAGKIRSIGKLRTLVREMLAEELKEIDQIVEAVLKDAKPV